ncbi:MAG: GNAT family N-acetyltransferase [Spirochaetaceae bacterium]|nr:GNAT family N-acetyltransferase [Spirochaetaceae bacterium]
MVRWRPVTEADREAAERFLRERERHCVTLCSRFRAPLRRDRLWAFSGRKLRDLRALLLFHNYTLFPALVPGASAGSLPGSLGRLLWRFPLHALHGPLPDAESFAAALEGLGLRVRDEYNYDLLSLDGPPAPGSLLLGPSGLTIGRPGLEHLEELFRLQAAYELEEVLPRGASFNAPASRLNLQRILAEEFLLAAWLDGKMVGKINTNAESFTRHQIGGVYVLPEYRGRGIAGRLTAELAAAVQARGRGLSLFVKKWNAAARAVYFRVGFAQDGDYRISYY